MKKILILGGSGMLGHMMALYFIKQKYTVDVTLSKPQTINYRPNNLFYHNFLNPCQLDFSCYDYVINCMGAIKQKNYSDDHLYYLNGVVPHNLALKCLHSNSTLIHYSSDCVFSGDKTTSYAKWDECDANDSYGRSKFLGETVKGITIRSSIIGPAKDSFGLFEWFKNETGTVKGFTNHIWSGLTTLEMAKQTEKIIQNQTPIGLYQLASNSVDKYSLLCKINTIFDFKKHIIPHGTNLVNRGLQSDFVIPSLDFQLNELKEWYHG